MQPDKFTGINVTIPYKTDVIRFLDELSPEAEKINALTRFLLKAALAVTIPIISALIIHLKASDKC